MTNRFLSNGNDISSSGSIEGIFTQNNNIGIGKYPLHKLDIDGQACLNGFKIIEIANGTNISDAVNKGQLDSKLNLTGGTLTGTINMSNNKITNVSDPTDNQDVATKKYVTDQISSLESYVDSAFHNYDADSQGVIHNWNPAHKIIVFGSNLRFIKRILPSSPITNMTKITISVNAGYNTRPVTLGHYGGGVPPTTDGVLVCLWYKIYGANYISLIYQNGFWIPYNSFNPKLNTFWLDVLDTDEALSLYLNANLDYRIYTSTNYNYIVKVKFGDMPNSTISGVSGFELINQSNLSATNFSIYFGGPVTYSSGINIIQYEKTSGELHKLRFFVLLNSGAFATFVITGLVESNHYMLCLYFLDKDGTNRPCFINHDSGPKLKFNSQTYTTNGANSNGCVCSYIWLQNNGTSTTFSIEPGSTCYLNALTVLNLYATLTL